MRPDWHRIDTVLLDMDGTLLDLHFDNHFWQEHLPLRYAEHHGISHAEAKRRLIAKIRPHAGTLPWYSVEHWARELSLDLMRFKEEVAHLIAVFPGVVEFLVALRAAGKRIVLVTNAHHQSLTLKMARTGLHVHFDAMITSHELGFAKEQQEFWRCLHTVESFDPARTLLVDDTLAVLDTAKEFGIAELRAVSKPDTQQSARASGGYLQLHSFRELLPVS